MAQTPTTSNPNTPRLQTQPLPISTRSGSASLSVASPAPVSSTTRTPTMPSATRPQSQPPRTEHDGDSPAWQESLPPPQTFDLLPPLHEILSRTLGSTASSSSLANGHGVDETQQSSSMGLQHPHPAQTREFPQAQPLELQHLVGAASEVRTRIRKARAAIEALPGVEWERARIEGEIEDAKRRVDAMRQVLAGLGSESGGLNSDT